MEEKPVKREKKKEKKKKKKKEKKKKREKEKRRKKPGLVIRCVSQAEIIVFGGFT